MPDLAIRNLDRIKQQYPEIHEALRDIQSAVNNSGQQSNVSPVGETPAPEPHAGLNVTAGGGYFNVQIQDSADEYRGREHFVEVSEDGWKTFHVEHLGASKTLYKQFGAKTLDFRSYSQYATSAPSQPVYARGINGANGNAPSLGMAQTPLQGYGQNRYTTVTPPKRS